jgi:two-component system sensor histidine kinase BaeS
MTRANWRIGTRLLLAQSLVLIAAIATAGIIAAAIGPSLFHHHMLKADHPPHPSELRHVEEAFRIASAISLGLAMAAALLIAFGVSWYLTRRFQTPLVALTQAATQVSNGHFGTRVDVTGPGPEMASLAKAFNPEMASLAKAFNTMASQLAHTEDTRRRLLSDLAHELRTPITTLNAYLEGIEDGVAEWDDHARLILRDQVERLSRLAEDIDAVSRAEEGRLDLQIEPISVQELVEAAMRSQSEQFKASSVALSIATDADRSIRVDRTRILQVMTNLLDNARRHTQSGGAVTIGWANHPSEVTITVTDTGDGIPADQLPHIFERFYRGDTARDRQRQGSGIGLTISKAIIDAHGGTLDAKSDGPGAGATFTVKLPVG